MQCCKRIRGKVALNILSDTDESEEELRGDTEDEGIEHDAEEDELEVDEEDGVDGEEGEGGGGRRKQSSRSRLCKSGVARQLVTHCRFKPSLLFLLQIIKQKSKYYLYDQNYDQL